MNITQKLLEEILRNIEKKNEEVSPQAVLHSDSFIKQTQSEFGLSAEVVKLSLRILCEAHQIFTIEIVSDDSRRGIEKVEGYIVTNLPIIQKLKTYYQDILCKIYEKQFHKHLMVHQVIKEIFPIIKSFNNTELGQVTNKTIMLMEYERMLQKNPAEYTPEVQDSILISIARREGFAYVSKFSTESSSGDENNQNVKDDESRTSESKSDSSPSVNGFNPAAFARAIDSPVYKEFSEKKDNYPLQRILNIYGLDFFVKVYLRKCNFAYLKQLIEDKQIVRKADLMLMKELVDRTKEHMSSDPQIENNKTDFYALERAISHAIYFTSSTRE